VPQAARVSPATASAAILMGLVISLLLNLHVIEIVCVFARLAPLPNQG
jgi:hypothetical protein